MWHEPLRLRVSCCMCVTRVKMQMLLSRMSAAAAKDDISPASKRGDGFILSAQLAKPQFMRLTITRFTCGSKMVVLLLVASDGLIVIRVS